MQIDPANRTLRAQAEGLLRRSLLSGRLLPGDKINEVALARELTISRGPLREAIRTLEKEGLLISIPHRGAYVRRLSPVEIGDLQEVRLALETSAALRVAKKLTPEIQKTLDRRLDELRAAENVPFAERLAADLAFHRAVCLVSGNTTLDELWRGLIGRITVMMLSVGEEGVGHLQAADGHKPLLDAIKSGDEVLIRETYREVFEYGASVVLEAVESTVNAAKVVSL